MIGTESLPNETSILELSVDQEFKNLIPPLSQEEYNGLEISILNEGCRDALVVWNGVIVDGHNRYEICKHHGKRFGVINKDFESRDAVKIWIIENQLARRNLPALVRVELALKYKPLIAAKAKENQIRTTENRVCQISDKQEIDTKKELAKVAGVSHDTINKVERVLEKAPELREKILSGDESINSAYEKVKKAEREEQRRITIKEEAELPNGKYHVILADPPWQYSNSGLAWSAENQYPTLSIQEIKEIPVKDLLEENAILFMWITNPILAEGWEVIRSWGFSYKTCMVWVKESTVPGFFVNGRHELLLIATKGQMQPTGDKPNSVIFGEVERHSKKPDGVYSIIEGMFPESKRLELFARNTRDGWESWGNQV